MRKLVARTSCFTALFICFLAWNATARSLQYDASEHASDGVSKGGDSIKPSFFLRLKGSHDSEEQCEQMYGFLPCSSNLPGHLFLIVVYEYLLYHGESYAGGDGRIFGVLGNNFFGASVFQLLDSLPDSLILLGIYTYFYISYFRSIVSTNNKLVILHGSVVKLIYINTGQTIRL